MDPRAPGSGRPSSLPPLYCRPSAKLGPGPADAEGPLLPTLRRTRFGGERLWVPQQQLQPLNKNWRARSQDILYCPSLPSVGGRGASCAASTAGASTAGGCGTPRSAASTDQAPLPQRTASREPGPRTASRESRSQRPRRRRHQEAHVRTIKAVYLGEGSRCTSADSEAYIDELLDRPRGPGLEDPNSADVRLRRELASLHTGEDAIKFFTKYGDTSETKVLYFNRPARAGGDEADEDNCPGPYDLVAVPKERAEPEHFTISPSGVVHFRPGQLSEFTPLAEWMHQMLMYRVLSTMALFRLHPKRKLLAQWRQSARYSAYCRHRQQVARRCFLAKPAFVKPLLKAKDLVREAGQVRLLSFPDQCCQLHEFVDMQRNLLAHPVEGMQRHLEAKHDALIQLLEHLAAAVERTADSRQSARSSAARPPPVPSVTGRSRSKSMGQEKQEARENARRSHVAQQDRSMLGDCVRLVDCMLQASLAAAGARTAEEFLQRVEAPCDQPRGALFSLAPVFGAAGAVQLEPPAEDFSRMLEDLWDGILRVVESVPTLASALAGPAREWYRRSLREVLGNGMIWTKCTDQSKDSLLSQLAHAKDYAREVYGPFYRIHSFGQDWKRSTFMEQDHTREALAEQMQRMVEFQEDLGRFRIQRVLGSMLLDARALRDRLTPVPEGALAAMKSAAALLARENCSSANRRLDIVVKALDERPKEGVATVSYVKLYEEASREQDRWPKVTEDVREVHGLLRRHGARVSADDEVQLDLLQEKVRRLARALSEATAFVEQRRASTASGLPALLAPEEAPSTPGSAHSGAEAPAAAEELSPEATEQEALEVTCGLGIGVASPADDAEDPLDVACGLGADDCSLAEDPEDGCCFGAEDEEEEEGDASGELEPEAPWLSTVVPDQQPVPSAEPLDERTLLLDGAQAAEVASEDSSKDDWRRSRTVRFATSPGGRVAFEELGTPQGGPG